jgi:hypothetical protein
LALLHIRPPAAEACCERGGVRKHIPLPKRPELVEGAEHAMDARRAASELGPRVQLHQFWNSRP